MKLFIRTEQSVIKDALTLTRPVFVDKYKGTASSEKILSEAYHQLRVFHVKSTSVKPSRSIPEHLRPILDPTVSEPDDAVVTTTNEKAPDNSGFTKVTILENKQEEVKKEKAQEVVDKKQKITSLLREGKSIKEVIKILADENLPVSYTYVSKLSKNLK